MPTNNDELLGKIFEMVNAKAEAKPKRKKREMTPEQRERCLANLRKGRETSMRKRKEKAAAKKSAVEGRGRRPLTETHTLAAVQEEAIPPSPPTPTPTPHPPPKPKALAPEAAPKEKPASPPPRAPAGAPASAPTVVSEVPVRLSTFGAPDTLW